MNELVNGKESTTADRSRITCPCDVLVA